MPDSDTTQSPQAGDAQVESVASAANSAPDSGQEQTLHEHGAGHPGEAVRAVIHHAVDDVNLAAEVVERRIESAEARLGERAGTGAVRALEFGLRLLVWLAVASYFIVAGTAVAARYWLLPHIDEMRPQLERQAAQLIGKPIRIGHIDAAWDGVRPRLRLQAVELLDDNGAVAASLPQVDAVISWRSVLQLRPIFSSLSVLTAEMAVRRVADTRWEVAGFPVDPTATGHGGLMDWVLDQPHIAIRDARIHYIDVRGSAQADGQTAAEAAAPIELTEVNLVSRSGLGGNRIALQARPPAALSEKIDVRLAFSHPWLAPVSDFRRWSGRLFVQFDYVDLAAVAALAAPITVDGRPIELRHAQGALRLWLDFVAMTSHRVRADVAATDVDLRLAPDLEPLVLKAVSGRITQQPWGGAHEDGEEILLTHVALDQGERLRLPPTDMALRWARPLPAAPAAPAEAAPADERTHDERTHGQFEAGRLSLAQLDALASHLPLPRRLHDAITHIAVAGDLSGLSLEWDGDPATPNHYALRSRFDGLTVQPETVPAAEPNPDGSPGPLRPGRPGFEQLSGSIEATEAGGNLMLDSHNAVLIFPGLFEEARIPATTLAASLAWSAPLSPDNLRVTLKSFQFANPDVDFSLSGNWAPGEPREPRGAAGGAPPKDAASPNTNTSRGPGQVDLAGHINRADATKVARYFPLLPSAAGVRRWLAAALQGGLASDGTLQLRGDLRDFPFVDPRRGEFRIATHLTGGTLDYMPQALAPDPSAAKVWPPINAVAADLVFERNRIAITAGEGTIFGVGLSNVAVVVDPIGTPQTRLSVDGEASGALNDMLRYVNTSPVGDWLGHFLASADASGAARLKLKFGLPLGRVREPATTDGTLFLAGNDVHLAPFLAPLTHAAGQVEFAEHAIRISGVEAGYLEGLVRIDANTAPDGAIKIDATGTATPRGLRHQVEVPFVQRLLDRADGTLHYAVNVTVSHGRTQVAVDSDLTGIALDLPAPLHKTATEALPLHLELLPSADDPKRDSLLVSAGKLIDIRLDRDLSERGEPRVDHGAIGVGVPATLPELGVIANIDLPQLDLDQWTPVISSLLSGSAGKPLTGPPAPVASPTGAGPAPGGTKSAGLPDLVAARVGTLTLAHKVFSHVVLGASRATGNAWTANVQSDHISGSVDWQPADEAGPGRISARLARMAIPESQREQVTQMIDETQVEPPSLDIVAEDFELGSIKLGRLELVAPATSGSWQLERLDISNPDGHFSATGARSRDQGGASGPNRPRQMALKVNLDIADAGRLLTRLGFPGQVQGGVGKLGGDLNWIGSPFAIDYPTLAGSLHLQTDKGQFLKAAPGAARLLGVLSLQSLPRRIGLDFRDIFSEGFAFDSINADANIASGVMSTHGFRMRGAAATVLIEGSTDLRAETQDLHVLVLPNINAGSASLVYALLANPAIGIGTFLAQLLLKDPLSKAFSFEYDVTGHWSDPQVVKRDKNQERNHPDAGATPIGQGRQPVTPPSPPQPQQRP